MKKVVHIVHWRDSGIFSVANELSIEGGKFGHIHQIKVLRKKKGAADFFLSVFRIFSIILSVIFNRNNMYHAHSFFPFMFLFFSSSCSSVTFHNLYPYFSSNSRRDVIKRFLIQLLLRTKKARVSAVSFSVSKAISNSMSIESVIIFNGLRPERYKFSVPHDKKILGSAGRLDDQKNYEGLINAFATIKSNDVVLRIAGDGVKKKVLEDLIDSHGLANRVVLLGHQSDIVSFYEGIDAFICSSFYEGFGLVLAEAMFSGKPVISTNVGLVEDFSAAKIIRSGFDVVELTGAINTWLDLPLSEIKSSVRDNQTLAAKSFSISTIYQQYVSYLWLEPRLNE